MRYLSILIFCTLCPSIASARGSPAPRDEPARRGGSPGSSAPPRWVVAAGSPAARRAEGRGQSGDLRPRPLAAGSGLTVDAFMADSMVKRGQQVTLLASAGGLEVRANGLALSDGGSADRVRVQNLASQLVVTP